MYKNLYYMKKKIEPVIVSRIEYTGGGCIESKSNDKSFLPLKQYSKRSSV